MKSCLLLILSVMTGSEATSQVKGCEDGWVEFTCEYPRATQKYKNIKVEGPRGNSIQSTKKDEWEKKNRFSLYHDTKIKTLRVVIKQLQKEDFGKYKCLFDQDSHEELELELVNVKDVCKEPFIQTANETAKTTITCDYPDKYKSKVKFICKDNDESCEEILSTPSPLKSNGTFTLTNTNSGFNVSISNVNSQHAGVYWCGMKQGRNRTSVRKIQLEIKMTPAVPYGSFDHSSWLTIAVALCLDMLLLLLMFIIYFVYERFALCKKRTNAA